MIHVFPPVRVCIQKSYSYLKDPPSACRADLKPKRLLEDGGMAAGRRSFMMEN